MNETNMINQYNKPKMNKCLYIFAVYLILSLMNGIVSFPFLLLQLTQYVFIGCGFLKIILDRNLKISSYMVWGALFAIFMAFSCIYCPNPSIAYQNSILPFCIQFCIYCIIPVYNFLRSIYGGIKGKCFRYSKKD